MVSLAPGDLNKEGRCIVAPDCNLQPRLLSIGLQWYFGAEESQRPRVHDRRLQNRGTDRNAGGMPTRLSLTCRPHQELFDNLTDNLQTSALAERLGAICE